MELVFSRDEFAFFYTPSLLSPLSHPLSSLLSPPSSLLSPMWQKLPYICNNFFQYSNLSITFLNCCTIEKSPGVGGYLINAHPPSYPATFISALTLCSRNGLSQLASPKSTIVTNSLLYALYIVCIFWRHPIKKE